MEVSAKELRTHTKRLLEAVERGEEVVITYRGKPRARVLPVVETPPRGRESALFGIWQDNPAVADVEGYVDSLRAGRH